MKTPFDYFDKIYCINLDSRPDRWNDIQIEFDKLGLRERVTRISAVTADEAIGKSSFKLKNEIPGQYGCCLSHHKCLQDAMNNELDSYLVFEDDMIFGGGINDLSLDLSKFDFNWELFLFGYVEWGTKNKENINEQICKIDKFGCTHAVGVKNNAFENLAEQFQRRVVDENTNRKNWFKRIDYFYSFVCNDIYALNNQVCFQRYGYSDITGDYIDRAECDD